MRNPFKTGDLVVYRKPKISTRPSPKAEDIHPAAHGDDYIYSVEKYWIVTRVVDEATIEVKTRTGKIHQLRADDRLLRRATLLERWLKKSRFPSP